MKLLLCVLVLLCFFLILIYFDLKKKFHSEKQTKEIIMNDKDNYYVKFSKSDLSARNVNSIKEYKQRIESSVITFSYFDILKLTVCMLIIDFKLNIYANTRPNKHKKFDFFKFKNIPWKVGVIDGIEYENGFPHTRQDTIILSSNVIKNSSIYELRELLLHEKVHLYQKKYNFETESYISNAGFKKHQKISESEYNIRANPDINNYIYKDKSDIPLMAIFNSEKPNGIGDIYYNHKGHGQRYEHPYETMAIEISAFCI